LKLAGLQRRHNGQIWLSIITRPLMWLLKVLAKRYVQPAEPEVPEQIPQIFKVFESYEPKWNNIVVQKNLPEKTETT
jgi:hypothetical protein